MIAAAPWCVESNRGGERGFLMYPGVICAKNSAGETLSCSSSDFGFRGFVGLERSISLVNGWSSF